MSWLAKNEGWLDRARERWRPLDPVPLVLRAWMWRPILWDSYNGVRVDGALQCMVVGRETGRVPDDVFAGCGDTVVDIQVPVADTEIHGLPIARASWGFPADDAEHTVCWLRKRSDPEGLRGNPNTSLGAYKSLNIPRPALVTSCLTFFVVGDESQLRELVPLITNIGRGGSGGTGRVHGWEIERCSEDHSLVRGTEAMRSIPIASEDEAKTYTGLLRYATTRAPYWHTRSEHLCVVPAFGAFGAA